MSRMVVSVYFQHPPSSAAFAMELCHTLSACGQVKRISSDVVRDKFGVNAFDSGHDFRLNAWLGMMEHR